MKEKLTLSIDRKILKKFKKLAEERGWIISKKVENFFKQLLEKK